MSSAKQRTYSVDHVRSAIAYNAKHVEFWLSWLEQAGQRSHDGTITESQALAVAAGARFSEAKINDKKKVTELVRRLLNDPPPADSDWVAVERDRVKVIAIEPGPFKSESQKPTKRLPIVFDPYSTLERLRQS